ncbi:MAG TPA: hypothetical protein VGL46_18550, partial [Pseudonocardiaceae bacterium]
MDSQLYKDRSLIIKDNRYAVHGGHQGEVEPPTVRFSGLGMRVRQAPPTSVACIKAHNNTDPRIPLNADKRMR